MKNFVFGSIFAIVLVGISIGAYFLGKSNNLLTGNTPTPVSITQDETSQVNDVISFPTPVSTENTKLTKAEMKAKIVTAISTKNYESLKPYMLSLVMVRKEASGCCGEISPDKAIAEMSYLNQADPPWLFDENNSTIKALKAAYPEYYGANSIVGISNDTQLVSIILDSDNMIKAISLAQSSAILLP